VKPIMEHQEYSDFLAKVQDASSKLLNEICAHTMIHVVSHLDSDGLSAAGVICSAIRRAGGTLHLRILRQLRRQKIEELAQEKDEVFVFVDLGSGQIEQIRELMPNTRIFILDHHPPETPTPEVFAHVNPHLHNIDGTSELSASGVAYLVAKAMEPSNIDLSSLAIIGAIGDQQDKGEQRSLTGLNSEIAKDAEKSSLVSVTKDIRLFGRETRPIHVALEYTTEPYMPGLTGNSDACAKLLLNLGIQLKEGENWRTISTLTQEEKTRLVSELVRRMLSRGMNTKDAESIIGTVYTLVNEDRGTSLRDAREFSSLLNACGRMGYPGLGVAVCMGERDEALKETQDVLSQYRRKLAEYLEMIEKPSFVKETKHLQYFNGENMMDDRMIGPVTSIAISSHLLKPDRPVVALAYSEDELTKVSMRATDEMVKEGINLGTAIREAVSSIGGEAEGGGHNIAAGAFIRKGCEETFLIKLEDSIAAQLNNKK
jgi:single-stranded-DNA-specific exonuclease